MNVRELIEVLKTFDENLVVYAECDDRFYASELTESDVILGEHRDAYQSDADAVYIGP